MLHMPEKSWVVGGQYQIMLLSFHYGWPVTTVFGE
jgi:hypothetical protein